VKKGNKYFIQGNEACALAALDAGANFYAGYPISPSSEIAEICSEELPKRGGLYIQMEDELSGMAAVIGASLAGKKAFTATSGPGFSLMQENIGFALVAEVPCVIINVQRYGAATGIATMPAQSDVMQARWGTHGDHSALVLAPSSVQECYNLTVTAFNLAERLRTPVIVLTDAVTAHLRENVSVPPREELEIWERPRPSGPVNTYLPYQAGTDLVPAMSAFGDDYILRVTGLIHDEAGFSTSNPQKAEKLTTRLIKKLHANKNLLPRPKAYNTEQADIIIIAYGITARAALAAATRAVKMGLPVGMIQLPTIWPFPKDDIRKLCDRARKVIVPEMNSGQLIREIKLHCESAKVIGINKINTEVITPKEIFNKISEIIASCASNHAPYGTADSYTDNTLKNAENKSSNYPADNFPSYSASSYKNHTADSPTSDSTNTVTNIFTNSYADDSAFESKDVSVPHTTSYRNYIAWDKLPHLWCAGCGHGIILKAVALALAELGIPREKALLASGIGCSGRSGDYVNFHRFQGTHGRTLAFATGIKLARPELTVVCIMGDGDCGAIGGNHILHAARRNLDVTAIVSNNLNYGMTGGQFSPLTPTGSITSTSRRGKAEETMDMCALAETAGANWVARTTVYHVTELCKLIKEALTKEGFSMLEVLTPCPTYYGRYNRIGGAVEMLKWLREITVPLKKYRQMPPEKQKKHFWRGKLVERNRPGYLQRYLEQEGLNLSG